MLIRISIEVEGKEVFSYETGRALEKMVDSEAITGIFEAVKHSSIFTDETIKKVQFYNMILYFKSYENFTLRLLVDETIVGEDLDRYFEELSKEIRTFIITTPQDSSMLEQESFQLKVKQVLSPLLQDPLSRIANTLLGVVEQETFPKVVLVGLSRAGKSSIKYRFFEGWSQNLAKQTNPTVGADYSQIFQEFLLHKFLVMDLGGQSKYRDLYLSQEEMWERISAFIFVIDIQDAGSFEAAEEYLSIALKIVSKVNTKLPNISLFFHKHDPDKRKEISENVSKCLEVFKNYVEFSNIYFTSVEDLSSNVALIKTLYVSLPDIVIMRLLKKEFLMHFENGILPQFSSIAKQLSNEGFLSIFQDIQTEIHQSAVMLGVAYESTFQKLWLNYLTGLTLQIEGEISSDSIFVNRQDDSLIISMKEWTHQGYPEVLTTLLFDGILEGILRTMQLPPPELIRKDGYSTWKITFE